MAKELQLTLQPGDTAPDFTAAASGGRRVSLADLRGRPVVLFFYPRDDTPG
jgi:peroxiredoxin Q/BCP